MFFKQKRIAKTSFFKRFLRTGVSVVVLTAFVLGLSLFIKQLSIFDPNGAIRLASPVLNPLLEKVGVSPDILDQVGEVAGVFVERAFKTNIAPSKNFKAVQPDVEVTKDDQSATFRPDESSSKSKNDAPVTKIAFFSDSHNNSDNLKKAGLLALEEKVGAIFFLGDYTDLGVKEDLEKAKSIMDEIGITYYSLPGDRDLYKAVGPSIFHEVFGKPKSTVDIKGTRFELLDNSANYTLVDDFSLVDFKAGIEKADFVVLAQPLYHPLASYVKPVMGMVKGEIISDIKNQANELLSYIRESKVQAVIAGDQHSYSISVDPLRDTLEHIVVGSIGAERTDLGNYSIALLTIDESGAYTVEEVFVD